MKSKKNREEWKKLVDDFNQSDLSMTKFSNENDIKPSTFIYWVKMFNKPEAMSAKLVKLPVKQITENKPIQIAINSIKLEIPGDMVTEKIAQLVSAIRGIA